MMSVTRTVVVTKEAGIEMLEIKTKTEMMKELGRDKILSHVSLFTFDCNTISKVRKFTFDIESL